MNLNENVIKEDWDMIALNQEIEPFISGKRTYRLPSELRINTCCKCHRVCVENFHEQPGWIKRQIVALGGYEEWHHVRHYRPLCLPCISRLEWNQQ